MSGGDARWIRRATLGGAALVLVALVWLAADRLLGRDGGARATPTGRGSAAVEALVAFERADIPDDQNAAAWLIAGAGAVVWSDDGRDAVGFASGRPFAQWDSALEARVRAALDRHRGALETLHRAAPIEASSYGIRYRDGVEAELPELLPLLRAARLLACEARVRFADGDADDGLLALATLGRMAESLYGESTLVTYLIAVASEQLMAAVACEVVAADSPWVHELFLDRLGEEVPDTDLSADMGRVLAAWEATIWAAVEGGVTRWDVGPKGGTALPPDLERSEVTAARARVEELLTVPYGTALDRFAALGTGRKLTGDDALESDLAGLGASVGRAQAVAAQRQLLRAVIALRRLALSGAGYPSERPTIPELSEPDPFTGRLIDYRPGDDRSLTLSLVGAAELLEPITVGGMSRCLGPVVLPPAGNGS